MPDAAVLPGCGAHRQEQCSSFSTYNNKRSGPHTLNGGSTVPAVQTSSYPRLHIPCISSSATSAASSQSPRRAHHARRRNTGHPATPYVPADQGPGVRARPDPLHPPSQGRPASACPWCRPRCRACTRKPSSSGRWRRRPSWARLSRSPTARPTARDRLPCSSRCCANWPRSIAAAGTDIRPAAGISRSRRALLLLAALAAQPLRAQPAGRAWPDRPIRIMVVYPPGGVSDQVARALA